MFDPETAQIGGMAAVSFHLTFMSQVKRRLPARWSGSFDFLNYPLAFAEMLLINPPFPYWQYSEWKLYVGGSLALGALASVTAKKVQEKEAAPSGD